jgi:hypothetical protein
MKERGSLGRKHDKKRRKEKVEVGGNRYDKNKLGISPNGSGFILGLGRVYIYIIFTSLGP